MASWRPGSKVPLLPDHTEIGGLGHEPLGERDLGPPGVPRLGDHLGVGDRPIEVPVGAGGVVRRSFDLM
jgi:hypothetical protein